MTSKEMTRAEMIRWLGEAIAAETEKPFEEIDYGFVDECGCLLDELMGKSAAMSAEEIAERMKKLKPDTTSAVRKKLGYRKLWKIAAAAAAVVLCMSVTAIAIPELRVQLLNVLQLGVGESVENGGITYTNLGVTKYYDDLDTLVAKENLDMLVYDDPNGELKVTSVKYFENVFMTVITFNDPTVEFEITHNQNNITDVIIDASVIYSTDCLDAYVLTKEFNDTLYYNAYIYYGNNTYIIKCQSDSTLHTILKFLRNGV